jgi:TPR repeat protein
MMFLNTWLIRRYHRQLKAIQSQRLLQPTTTQNIKKEIVLLNKLVKCYQKLIGSAKHPYALLFKLESLRKAAELDDPRSAFLLAEYYLNEGCTRQSIEEAGELGSSINIKKMKDSFEEAHAYLSKAVALNSIEAKRLRGLAYIRGFGVQADENQGFEWIIESINDEKAWDKVTDIFTKLELNTPEFFAKLNRHRAK